MAWGRLFAGMLLLVVFYLALIGELAFLDFLIYASFSFLFVQKTGAPKAVETEKRDWVDQTIKELAPSLP
jgi:hypothetical protein